MTATELARNLSAVLDKMLTTRQEYIIERNQRPVAKLVPIPRKVTALEAFGPLYRTLSPEEGKAWREDIRKAADSLDDSFRNPWDT